MRRSFSLLGGLLLCAAIAAAGRQFPYTVEEPGEVVVSLRMRAPGADWEIEGHESALVSLTVDGRRRSHVMLFAGEQPFEYKIFLGPHLPGKHWLDISRKLDGSSHHAEVEILGAQMRTITRRDPYFPVLAHAPVLFARKNTIGKFTDIPMLMYCERLTEAGADMLQYSVIFTNEDGGTSTRKLMARWGRTTDIEYIYKVFFDKSGAVAKATIQAKDHKEVPYEGVFLGAHPLLIPVTDNNMVSGGRDSSLHYQLQPSLVDLSTHSREWVMDQLPVTYQIARKELIREGKLREYGKVDGEKISDPKNYAYIEYKVKNAGTRTAVMLRRKDEQQWHKSHLDVPDMAIDRDGWVRSALELPPGTRNSDLAEIGFECMAKSEKPGSCKVEQATQFFLLDADAKPGSAVSLTIADAEIPVGQTKAFPLAQ